MYLPTATLLLLLGSHLATSAPISTTPPPPSCIEGHCNDPSILHHLTTPHVPATNPFSNINEAIEITPPTNSHLTISISSSSTPANNAALSAAKPLSTLSLTSLPDNPEKQRQQSLALLKVMAKDKANNPDGHVHLHELPKNALASFWTSERASRRGGDHKPHRGCHGGGHHGRKHEAFIYLPGNIYVKSTQYISRRPDIAVVGIVLAFLCLVVCLEAGGRIRDSLRKSLGCTDACRARGAIYLPENDEKVPFARKQEVPPPICAQPSNTFPPNHHSKSEHALEQV